MASYKYLILLFAFIFNSFAFGLDLIGGTDIRLDSEQASAIRNKAIIKNRTWDDGLLPIVFDRDITRREKVMFYRACKEWEEAANIRCRPRKNEKPYLFVQKRENNCSSNIGPGVFDKKRVLNLSPRGCWYHRIILHELGHALGFYHEHQRRDRSRYLEINWSNIQFTTMLNFTTILWQKPETPYDFDSIMHYDAKAFGKERGLVTMWPKPPYVTYAFSMGKVRHLSKWDKKAAREFYGDPR